MKIVNIVVEGSAEETFVNDVIKENLSPLGIYVSARRITTGWDKINNKKSKGGITNFAKFQNEITRWITSDRGRQDTIYTTFVDLYAFPKDKRSPYTSQIRDIKNLYQKIEVLQAAIAQKINHPQFIPYIQLHEFESLILVEPDRLLGMYPDTQREIRKLKEEIGDRNPEEINESYHTAPSKRIIKYFPDYEGQKAQVGPLVAEEIGMTQLRNKCPHFNEWITKLEAI